VASILDCLIPIINCHKSWINNKKPGHEFSVQAAKFSRHLTPLLEGIYSGLSLLIIDILLKYFRALQNAPITVGILLIFFYNGQVILK